MEVGNQALVNLKEIARVLNVSDYRVYYWVERNEIPFVRVGRHLRFIVEEVIKYFLARTEERKARCQQRERRVNTDENCSLKIGASARMGNFTSPNEE